jgi:hypothetical protein
MFPLGDNNRALPEQRMERVHDLNLTPQNPGIMRSLPMKSEEPRVCGPPAVPTPAMIVSSASVVWLPSCGEFGLRLSTFSVSLRV